MIKGVFIDLAHAIVCGGDITDESAVWREEVAAFLPAAVNFVALGALWEQFKMEGDKDIPNTFYVPFVNQTLDMTGPVPVFTIPSTVVPLPSDRGIRMVTSPQGDNVYQRMNDNLYSNWNYYKDIMLNQRYYRPVGMTIYLYNKPPLETKANIYLLTSADTYGDNDELPVPAGKEMIVVQQMAALFMRQEAQAEHKIQFKSDINK